MRFFYEKHAYEKVTNLSLTYIFMSNFALLKANDILIENT